MNITLVAILGQRASEGEDSPIHIHQEGMCITACGMCWAKFSDVSGKYLNRWKNRVVIKKERICEECLKSFSKNNTYYKEENQINE